MPTSDVGEMKKERENAGLRFREQDEEKNPSGFPEHGTKFIQVVKRWTKKNRLTNVR